MSEFTSFRTKLKAWLEGIAAVSAAVGSRVYAGLPAAQPTFPIITYALRNRRSATDVGAPAWAFETEISLYGPDLDVLETVHDAILENLAANAETMGATLSEAGVSACVLFQYESSDEDPHEAFIVEGRTIHALILRCPTVLIKAEEAYPT